MAVLFWLRFLTGVDQRLRSQLAPRKGELSRTIVLILNTVDLATVPILTSDHRGLAPPTSVKLPLEVHALLKETAKARKVTMNKLLNSAIDSYYNQTNS